MVCPPIRPFFCKLKSVVDRCGEALEKNKHLIGEDQREYQREMERNFITFKEKISFLLPEKRMFGSKTRRRR